MSAFDKVTLVEVNYKSLLKVLLQALQMCKIWIL